MKASKYPKRFRKNLYKRYIDIKHFMWYPNFKNNNKLELDTGVDL